MKNNWVRVPITSNVEKLWSCPNFCKLEPEHIGKKPSVSGQMIRIDVNRASKSIWCDGEMWPVHPDDEFFKKIEYPGQKFVCSHQVDVD